MNFNCKKQLSNKNHIVIVLAMHPKENFKIIGFVE